MLLLKLKTEDGVIRYEKGYEEFARWLGVQGIENVISNTCDVEDKWIRGRVKLLKTEFGEFLLKEKRSSLFRSSILKEFQNGILLKESGVAVLSIVVCVSSKKYKRDYGFLPYISGSLSGLHIIKNLLWNGFSDSLRKRVVWTVADIVARMHTAGFVHGDLNPSNLLIYGLNDRNLKVYLLDFGGVRKSSSLFARVKDLARLWRSAKEVVSERDGFRFLRRYLSIVRGDIRDYIYAVERRLRKIRKR